MRTLATKATAAPAQRRFAPQRLPAVRQILRAPTLQTKLEVGGVNDPAEHEADRVADAVMRMPGKSAPPSVSAVAPSSTVHRKCASCAVEDGALQRRAAGPEGPGAPPEIVHRVLNEPGQPLDCASRAFFEPRFGEDFSTVRVHSGVEAARSAHAINAQAYTFGQSIVLGGAPGPHTMAHELAHVVQQRGGNSTTLRRQQPGAAPRMVQGSAGSISWIDPSSPAGSHVPDPRPGATISESDIRGGLQFRFANYLHAYVNTLDSVHVANFGFFPNSGIARSISYGGIPSWSYEERRHVGNVSENGVDGIEFDQTVGARTISPGAIGGAVGAAAGATVGGLAAGGKLGAAIGSFAGPLGTVGGALVGAGIGYLAGSFAASRMTNFPPIWTKLRLRLMANGNRTCRVLQHSHFPSQSYYCDLSRIAEYNALAGQQTLWENYGWGAGNPWGVTRPWFTP